MKARYINPYLKGVVDTSYDEGKEEGKKEKKTEIARMMKKKNYPVEEIIELTGLTHREISDL